MFTITVIQDGFPAATLLGLANGVHAGQTVTFDMTSNSTWLPGPYDGFDFSVTVF
jgi:hypothetical protein